MKVQRGHLIIADEPGRLDKPKVVRMIKESYWGTRRTEEQIIKSIDHSVCFGVYDGDTQIGFARVITDYATFAYLCDVIIEEAYRGQKLGEWLVGVVIDDERFKTARFALFTRDAQDFYRKKFGFKTHQFDALVRDPNC